MKNKRPVNLDLRTIHFPTPAIASILHRMSGFILFLMIPFLLWVLKLSLGTPDEFNYLSVCLDHPVTKFFLWMFMSAFSYHFVAGIRHLLMDMGYGETLQGGKRSAKTVLVIATLLSLLVGVWLW